jgi:hypothetical protein
VNFLIDISVTLARQIFAFPELVARAGRLRIRRTVMIEREAERLDRIRNPLKYRGR